MKCRASKLGHRSAKAKRKCLACTPGPSHSISLDDGSADPAVKSFYRTFLTDLHIDQELFLKHYQKETASVTQSLDEDLDLARYYYLAGSVFNQVYRGKPDSSRDGKYSDRLKGIVQEHWLTMQSYNSEIRGTLHRGMRTERFKTQRELDAHVQDTYGVGDEHESGFWSTSRSPVVGACFAAGFRKLPDFSDDESLNMRLPHRRKSEGGKNSGYLIEISDPYGVSFAPSESGYSPRDEKEVVILPFRYRVDEVVLSRDSMFSKPIVRVSFLENTEFDMAKKVDEINSSSTISS